METQKQKISVWEIAENIGMAFVLGTAVMFGMLLVMGIGNWFSDLSKVGIDCPNGKHGWAKKEVSEIEILIYCGDTLMQKP